MKARFVFLLAVMYVSGFSQKKTDSLYREKYRPQFHFTPAKNWANDPNGLVYYKGTYHLFYQHNPFGNTWGHMSWGHAISKDLVRWKQMPVAIPEANNTMIFSGSCVIDEQNTAGFAKKPGETSMVAIYTGDYVADKSKADESLQAQYIAYSLDDGLTWTKYENNPVLDLHKKDFRDPAVFWYAAEKKWVMVVSLPLEHIVQFYSSSDLKKWEHLSDFGPAGDTSGVWECPALIPVPVESEVQKSKWVLLNSVGTAMQYFVGSFDGTKFNNENPPENIYRPDSGPDYYAGIVFAHLPTGEEPVLMAWANNWKYATDIPVSPWKSAMALPRRLSLIQDEGAWLLKQRPVVPLSGLRGKIWRASQLSVKGKKLIPVRGQQVEMVVKWRPVQESFSGIRLAVGKANCFSIAYDEKKQSLRIDRAAAGDTGFNKNFSTLSNFDAPLKSIQGKITLHIFFDNSLVEVFANDGMLVMTAQLFPDKINNGIELFSSKGKNIFDEISVWQLKTAW